MANCTGHNWRGLRYVPVLADPIEWDNTRSYEHFTIVTYQGDSYTSKQDVPPGIDITNSEYWVRTGSYNGQIEQYRQEVSQLSQDVKRKADWYNNVSELRASTRLKANTYVCTGGYYEPGDGGDSCYYVREKTENDIDDGGSILVIGDYACELIVNEFVTPEQFGAYGDNSHDDTEAIQKCIDFNCPIVTRKNYSVSNSLYVTTSISMEGESYFNASKKIDVGVYIAQSKNGNHPNMWYYDFKINYNANGVVNTSIGISNPKVCNIYLNVRNAGETGVNLNITNSGGNRGNRYWIEVEGNNNGTTKTGILYNSDDNYAFYIRTRNCLHGLEVRGQLMANFVHCWCDSIMKDNYNNTVCLYFPTGQQINIVELYQDSVYYGIYTEANASGPMGTINNFYYNNTVPTFSGYLNLYAKAPQLIINNYFNRMVETSFLTYNTDMRITKWGVSGNNGSLSTELGSSYTLPFTDLNDAPTIGNFPINANITNCPIIGPSNLLSFVSGSNAYQIVFDAYSNDIRIRYHRLQPYSNVNEWSKWYKISSTS